jgi:hypothetical protein
MTPITAEEELSRNTDLKREDIAYLRNWTSKWSGVAGD